MLEYAKYEVVGMASNGQRAVEIFDTMNPKPDIILMDHRMPIKNGIQAAREILKQARDVKIIFASADRSIKKQAFEIGAVDFIEKPFNHTELIKTIKAALSSKRENTLL